MTLAAAWERNTPSGSELVFASDSRVRQGGEWDCCPKLFRLPRSDAMLALAGDTMWAYPIALQAIAGMQDFGPSRSGHYDLRALRSHIMRTIDGMMDAGSASSNGLHTIGFEFLFGGWCWQELRFRLWRLYWSRYDSAMRHDTIENRKLGLVRFVGDRDPTKEDPESEVVGHAKEMLSSILRERHGPLTPNRTLDMEPWEVLLAIIRSGEHPTVGGPPQLAKVYRSMNSSVFSVLWPDRAGEPTLLGRKLLDYERTEAPQVDPDDWHSSD
jgi:hypothetical protein